MQRKQAADLEPGDVITIGNRYVTVGAYPNRTVDGWLRLVDETGTWVAHYLPTDTVRLANFN